MRMRGRLARSVRPGFLEREIEDLRRGEGARLGIEFPGREPPGVVRDGEELAAVGAGVDGGVDRGVECDGAVHEAEDSGVGVELEGVEGAVADGDAFVHAVEVVVLGVEVDPGGVGLAPVAGFELAQVVGAVGGVGEVQGCDGACVGRDVEFGCGGGGDQRRGG